MITGQRSAFGKAAKYSARGNFLRFGTILLSEPFFAHICNVLKITF